MSADAFDISVCLPTYNGSAHVAQAIASVAAQDYRGRLEVLVCDDHSTDGTPELAMQAAAQAGLPLRLERNERNLGLVGNWNRCLEHARGRYVHLLFQDDWLEPSFLSEMVGCAETQGLELVLCDRQYHVEPGIHADHANWLEHGLPRLSWYASGRHRIEPNRMAELLMRHLLGPNFLGEPVAGVLRRATISRIGGFDPSLRQLCDLEFWLRMALAGLIGFLPERLVNFRVHMSSTSSRNAQTQVDVVDRIVLADLLLRSPKYANFRGRVGVRTLEVGVRRRFADLVTPANHAQVLAELPTELAARYGNWLEPGLRRRAAHALQRL